MFDFVTSHNTLIIDVNIQKIKTDRSISLAIPRQNKIAVLCSKNEVNVVS